MAIDNTTSRTHTVVSVICADRKGLVYDLMRTLKDVHVRTAFGRISTKDPQRCSIDVFVQEADNQAITDKWVIYSVYAAIIVTTCWGVV